MELNPKVLITGSGLTSGLLWNFRIQAKNIRIVTETNLPRLVQSSQDENPDLILIDLFSLDDNACNMIRALREHLTVPLLVLHTSQDTDSILKIYQAGVDDCILKPIDVSILQAKVIAWLNRRSYNPREILNPLRIDNIYMIPMARMVRLDNGSVVHLTNKETRLLYILMSRAGQPVLTNEMIEFVWGEYNKVWKEVLKITVYRLRQKLKIESANLAYIETVSGVGYQFVRPTQREEVLEKMG